jgi:hypothetical protein
MTPCTKHNILKEKKMPEEVLIKPEDILPKEFVGMSHTQTNVEADLLAKQNVVGVALGHKTTAGEDTGKPAILVLVNQKVDPKLLTDSDMVPETAEDQVTDVVEVGDIFAGGGPPEDEEEIEEIMPGIEEAEEIAPQTLRQRIRPVMGGFSVGHPKITAGTIATCCYDLSPFPGMPRRYYILSNNHVLANSNSAKIGDPILQPGPYDGGRYSRDLIARLSRFVPIRWRTRTSAPCNYVDAAIAEGPFHLLNRQIYWIGHVKQLYAAVKVGDIVEKTGRTTNFTTGKVTATNATVDVNYGGGRVARFCRQILTTAMSAGGDSGSLVCDRDERAVGLLFAGSSSVTVLNNILYVQSMLRIRLTEK